MVSLRGSQYYFLAQDTYRYELWPIYQISENGTSNKLKSIQLEKHPDSPGLMYFKAAFYYKRFYDYKTVPNCLCNQLSKPEL